MKTKLFPLAVALLFIVSCNRPLSETGSDGLWSVERSIELQNRTGWLNGCNFLPSTAVNALDMWQKETSDPVTIERELGWAEDMGFNIMRVWLNSLVWKNDPEGFKKTMLVQFAGAWLRENQIPCINGGNLFPMEANQSCGFTIF